jgi:uncharacterized protein YcfL
VEDGGERVCREKRGRITRVYECDVHNKAVSVQYQKDVKLSYNVYWNTV